MEIFTRNLDDNGVLIELIGELDAQSCATVRPAFARVLELEAVSEVRLDLAEVEFLDSSGVGAIVFLWKRLNEKGQRLVLQSPSGQPAKLLKMLRIDKSIDVAEMAL